MGAARVLVLRALPGDFVPGRDWERVPPGRAVMAAAAAEQRGGAQDAGALLPLALVLGRVSHVLWPPAHAGRLPRRTPRY